MWRCWSSQRRGRDAQTVEHSKSCSFSKHARVLCPDQVRYGRAGMIDVVEDDIRAQLAGTFLRDAADHTVSAHVRGAAELTAALNRMSDEVEERSGSGPSACVDRVFTLTVSDSRHRTLVSGTIRVGDAVNVLPKVFTPVSAVAGPRQKAGRRFGRNSRGSEPGGVETTDLQRGSVCVPPATCDHDANRRPLSHACRSRKAAKEPCARAPSHRTAEVLAVLRCLTGRDHTGGEGFIQFRSETPLVAARGDRFVIRSYSPCGCRGGTVLEPHANGTTVRREGPSILTAKRQAIRPKWSSRCCWRMWRCQLPRSRNWIPDRRAVRASLEELAAEGGP